MKLVADGGMTVTEVCLRLNINRSTYKLVWELAKQDGLMEPTQAPNEKVRIPIDKEIVYQVQAELKSDVSIGGINSGNNVQRCRIPRIWITLPPRGYQIDTSNVTVAAQSSW